MKKKYFVIFAFVSFLIITIYMMMKIENKIREEKTIVIDSTKVRINLLPEYSERILQSAFDKTKINFRVKGDYFEIYSTDRKNSEVWAPVF